jgi:hypothetical protein
MLTFESVLVNLSRDVPLGGKKGTIGLGCIAEWRRGKRVQLEGIFAFMIDYWWGIIERLGDGRLLQQQLQQQQQQGRRQAGQRSGSAV